MLRLACLAGLVARADGLQTTDSPAELHGGRAAAGSVSALDPELTNIAGEKFHVTTAGEFVMIGLPSSCNPEVPDACELIFKATFDKLENDSDCNDLMIRNLSIQGTKVASGAAGVTKVDFSILSDVGNSSDALGFQVNDGPYLTPTEFATQVPSCTVSQQRGYFQWPTKRTYRFRTTTYNVECLLDFGNHEFKMHFNTAYRGTDVDTRLPVYANDISLSLSNVGTTAIGLLGTDDNTAVTAAVPGCNKKQPVSGPYQVRHGPKFPKRHHWGAR